MRSAFLSLIIGIAVVLVASTALAQTAEYRAARAPDGNPDLNGIWQALGSAQTELDRRPV